MDQSYDACVCGDGRLPNKRRLLAELTNLYICILWCIGVYEQQASIDAIDKYYNKKIHTDRLKKGRRRATNVMMVLVLVLRGCAR